MSATNLFADQLEGRTVLILGGTSGIGLSAAIQAKAAGAQVIVLGANRERAEKVAVVHGFAGWRTADVAQPEALEKALADIPHIDHLLLLVDRFVVGKVLEAAMPDLRRIFDERVCAAIQTLRTLGDRLAADGTSRENSLRVPMLTARRYWVLP